MKEAWRKLFRAGSGDARTELARLHIADIDPNPYQPRTDIGAEELKELAESIKVHGVLQPILVTAKDGGRYALVAGERRLRAAEMAGLSEVPAVIASMSDVEIAEAALIENLQRKDLNCIEEARGYERLIQEFGFTQEDLGVRLGRSQSAIANKLRLLRLGEGVQNLISREIISERHGRALLRFEDQDRQIEAARAVAEGSLSVRETEQLIDRMFSESAETASIDTKRSVPAKRRITRVLKDIRLFRNSMLKLTRELGDMGFRVDVEEQDETDTYTMVIVVKKSRSMEQPDGQAREGGANGKQGVSHS